MREQITSIIGRPRRHTLLRRVLTPLSVSALATAHLLTGRSDEPIARALFLALGPLHIFVALFLIGVVIVSTSVFLGWLAGMSFEFATAGPLQISRHDGQLRIGINQEWKGFHGTIHMMPPGDGLTTFRAICYFGAGTVASAPLAFAGVYTASVNGWAIDGGSLPDGLPGMFIYWFLAASLYVVIIEFAKGGIVVVHLLTQPHPSRQQILKYLTVASLLVNGHPPRTIDPAMISGVIGAGSSESSIRAMGQALAYIYSLDIGRVDDAALWLAEIRASFTAQEGILDLKTLREFLHPYLSMYHEIAFVAAVVDRDVDVALHYMDLGKRYRTPRLTALRAGIATLIAAGDEDGAATLAREAIDDTEPLPLARRWRAPYERRIMRQLLRYEMHQTGEVRGLIAELDAQVAATPAGPLAPGGRAVRSITQSFAAAVAIMAIASAAVIGSAVAVDAISTRLQPEPLFGESTRLDLGLFLERAPDLQAAPSSFDPLPEIMAGMSQDTIDYVSAMYWHHERMARSGDRDSIIDFVPFGKKRRLLSQAALWQVTFQRVDRLTPPRDFREFHDHFVSGLAEYDRAAQEFIAYYDDNDRDAMTRARTHAERGSELIDEASQHLDPIWGNPTADGTSPEIIDALLKPDDLNGDWYLQSVIGEGSIRWGPIVPCTGDTAFDDGHMHEIGLARMATFDEPKRYLRQTVVQSDLPASATAVERVRGGLTCDLWIDGAGDDYHLLPLDMPPIGHDSVAYRLRVTDDDYFGPWDSHVIVARVGNVVLEVWHYETAGEPDIDATIQIVERALQRIHDSSISREHTGS